MNIASIDIGSNSIILLIARNNGSSGHIIPVANYYRTPRISRNLSQTGIFDREAIERLKGVIAEFKELSLKHDAEIILASATQAFRKAGNAKEVTKEIFDNYAIAIETISGTEEAYLSYLGAISLFPDFKGYLIDIGGGSSEIIKGDNGKILFSHSYNAGTVSLCNSMNGVPPLNNNAIIRMREQIKEAFMPPVPGAGILHDAIAVAGAPTTLACMDMGIKEFDEKRIEGYTLYKTAIEKLIIDMSEKAPEKILNDYGEIIAGREDVMLTGTLILDVIMELLNLDFVRVSTRGLRHGIILDYLKKSIGQRK